MGSSTEEKERGDDGSSKTVTDNNESKVLSTKDPPARKDGGSPTKASDALIVKPLTKASSDALAVKTLLRSNSSPALLNASKRRSKYDKCESLTELAQVLFSTDKQKPPTTDDKVKMKMSKEAKREKELCTKKTSEDEQARIITQPCDKTSVAQTKQPYDETKLNVSEVADSNKKQEQTHTEEKTQPTKKHDQVDTVALENSATQSQEDSQQKRSSQKDGKQTTKRRHSMPVKKGNESTEQKRRSSRSNLAVQRQHKTDASKLKGESDKKPRSSSSNKDAMSTHPGASKSRKDLLSSFVTYNDIAYNDKLPAPPRYSQLPQHSPKRESRLPSLTKAKQRGTQASLKPIGASADGVEMCAIESSEQSRLYKSPESQRPAGGLSKSSKTKKLPSPTRIHLRQPRNVLPLVFDILRIITIMFCIVSVISRSFMAFGGKMPLINYIINSPMLWILRWFIASFHVMFILLELDLGIPVFLPNTTLDNWFQRGYLFSFIGLLDLCMNSNQTLETLATEIEEDQLTNRGIRMRLAFAALGISSRGLIACGLAYCLFAVASHTGETKRNAMRNHKHPVGLAKRAKAPTQAAI